MGHQFSEKNHWVPLLRPVADAFAGTVYAGPVKMSNLEHGTFLIDKAVGATGTSTITVEAVDDVAGNNPVAIPFRWRACTSGDTWGALTYSEAAGFATTAGSNHAIQVHVDAEKLGASGKAWMRLKAVEVVDSPVLGSVSFMGSNPRFGEPFLTALA